MLPQCVQITSETLHRQFYLPTPSTIVTVASAGWPTVTPLGNNKVLRVRVNSSFPSTKSSWNIGTTKKVLVVPAGIVTLYGPEL